jgi:hypothetical protein
MKEANDVSDLEIVEGAEAGHFVPGSHRRVDLQLVVAFATEDAAIEREGDCVPVDSVVVARDRPYLPVVDQDPRVRPWAAAPAPRRRGRGRRA